MLRVDNLKKNFGTQLLFENVNFTIGSTERVGLVGRNGNGKTTLFHLITGLDLPDEGTVSVPKNYRIGYVTQELLFKEETVLKEGCLSLPKGQENCKWKVEKILYGLGFSENDMNRPIVEFSGGYQVRLNLAKILVSEPDLILLDEPTNYLDITSIRWIERFLVSWQRGLILITHDRSFMDKVVTHVIGIHRKKIRKVTGNTEKFYNQMAQEESIYEKTRLNDDRMRKEVEQFINRFRAKARLANLVQSRIKQLEKKEKQEKLDQIKNLDFSFRYKNLSGKYGLTAKNISFSYQKNSQLINDFNIAINADDRVCIVGKNGKGKTTLLKILANIIKPETGEIIYHPNIKSGVFEQTNVQSLVENRTVEEEILYSDPDMERQLARNICGAMMFEGDLALKKISVLSGGEKSRVMLGKILANPVNLLLLDEPTNHLDMESCDALLSAIDNFEGAVIMVTHNEMFLHALAKRLIIFKNDKIEIFEGSYQEFLEKGGWEDEEKIQKQDNQNINSKLDKKEQRRKRSEIIIKRSKILKPLEQNIIELENVIESNEKLLNELNLSMIKASYDKNGTKISEISQAMHKCQRIIDDSFNELEKVTKDYEYQNNLFEEKINHLGI